MLAKLTSKNQLTPSKAVLSNFKDPEYFEVVEGNGRIVLTPVRSTPVGPVRAKLAERVLSEADIAEAVAWSRHAP